MTETVCYRWSIGSGFIQLCADHLAPWQAALALAMLTVLTVVGLGVIYAGIRVILALRKYEKSLRKLG